MCYVDVCDIRRMMRFSRILNIMERPSEFAVHNIYVSNLCGMYGGIKMIPAIDERCVCFGAGPAIAINRMVKMAFENIFVFIFIRR